MRLFTALLTASMIAWVAAPSRAEEGTAKRPYGMAGCGLGTLLIESQNPGPQIFVYTTDGTFGSQTFGISSGTSNCTTDGVAKLDKEQELFAEVNFDDLAKDMAAGRGEYLTAFAAALGCNAEVHGLFAGRTQENYETIYPRADVTAAEVVDSTKNIARQDPALAAQCSRL